MPALDFAGRHRRGLAAAFVTLLAGSAVTAFGIAPLAPDAADLPQRLIAEPAATAALSTELAEQAAALAEAPLALRRSDLTRDTDTPERLLARLGANDASAAAFLRSDAIARRLLAGRAGKAVQATVDESGALLELVARFPAEGEAARTQFSRLTLARAAGAGGAAAWTAHLETAPLVPQLRLGSGAVASTLFAATDDAGLPDAVASQLAEIFATDIDFHRELRRGDSFSVVYEVPTADGEPAPWSGGANRVVAAEFVNDGQTYQAFWFGDSTGRGGWYDAQGRSKKRSFLASPLEFSRISSGFSMRFHPIQQIWKRHLGVDYAAPMGTPVRAIGNATVAFAGVQNGYGNVVHLDHGNGRETVYAHLSHIDVRKGQRIEQGQRIGLVGMTGWATGPHLHFEFKVGGEHHDPLQVAKASEQVLLSAAERPRFAGQESTELAQLAVARTMGSARAE